MNGPADKMLAVRGCAVDAELTTSAMAARAMHSAFTPGIRLCSLPLGFSRKAVVEVLGSGAPSM